MNAAITGVVSGLIVILLTWLLKQINKSDFYGLTLCEIGFLYVGFTWSDTGALIVTSIQAIVFLFLAYYGIRKNLLILVSGFFLHGCWDLAYGLCTTSDLIPPHYDIFCLSIDFTMGAYLLLIRYQPLFSKKIALEKNKTIQ